MKKMALNYNIIQIVLGGAVLFAAFNGFEDQLNQLSAFKLPCCQIR